MSAAEQPAIHGEILIYPEGASLRLEVRLEQETVWLTLNQMASLFQVDKSGISRHLKNIFETGELVKQSVVANYATTATDGKTYRDLCTVDSLQKL